MKNFLYILLVSFIGFNTVNSQVLFSDLGFANQTKSGEAPDPTKYYAFSDPAKPQTFDSTIDNTWEFRAYSDLGLGFYSSSRWKTGTGTASDYLVLFPLKLNTVTSPVLKFDAMSLDGGGKITVKAVNLPVGTIPSISSFATAATVYTKTFTEQDWTTTGQISLTGVTGSNVYIAIINESTAKDFIGVKNIVVYGKIQKDLSIVSTTIDTGLIKNTYNISSLYRSYYELKLNDSTRDIFVTVRNDGTSPITNFICTHDVTFGATNSDTLTGLNIAPGALYTFKHSKKAIFSNANDKVFVFKAWISTPNDTLPLEDTTSNIVIRQISYNMSAGPYNIDFEGPGASPSFPDFDKYIQTLQLKFARLNYDATDTVKLFAPRAYQSTSPIFKQAVYAGVASASLFPVTDTAGNPKSSPTRQFIMFPPITFEAGKKYAVKYHANTIGDSVFISFFTSSNNTQSEANMTTPVSSVSKIGTPVDAPLEFNQALTLTGTGNPMFLSMRYLGVWYCFIDDITIEEIKSPVVDFVINTDDQTAQVDYDSSVTFTNNTTGTGTITYKWDFGAGASPATSTSSNPGTVKYSSIGVKTVTLTADNGTGPVTKTRTFEIKAVEAPKADFSFVVSAKKVTFTNKSTPNVTTPANAVLKYEWDFADGSAVNTTKNPVYTYTNPGTYNVCLTATNSAGNNQVCKDVKIAGSTVSISTASDLNKFIIYPNPVKNGEINIESAQTGKMQVRIIDILGKQIQSNEFKNAGVNKLDVSNLGNGVYFVELETKQGKQIEKIIVDK